MKSTRLPARVQLQIKDSETGSYPTISRIVNDGRTGRYPTFFDDGRTVIFESGVMVGYPGLLHSSSQFLQYNSGNLIASGTVRKGIGDSFVHYPMGQSFNPFDESDHLEQGAAASNDPFYLTGSRFEDVGLGLGSSLKSKTKITIDITPVTSSLLSSIYADGEHYSTAYFGFGTKAWEPI